MFDFTTNFNRENTQSAKWDMLKQVYSLDDATDILPMWVADMDFAIAPVILESIQKRMEHPIFGYSFPSEEVYQVIMNWLNDRHRLAIEKESVLLRHGVIPALTEVIDAFTDEGDTILTFTPIYPPLTSIPHKLGRVVETCLLIEKENSFEIDFEEFEKSLQQNVKAFILCNPHNPAGKVWSKEDLTKIAALCQANNVLVFSDEIHSDLIFKPNTHTSLLSVAEDPANIITFFAPTKTFNIAGIQAAVMIVSDSEKRKVLNDRAMKRGEMGLNIFSLVALQAAYEKGAPWLEELLVTLSSNMDYVIEQLSTVAGIKVSKPDATYLMWIDYRGTGLSEKEIMHLLLTKGKVAVDPGTKYGEAGNGFLRINVACPPSLLEDGIARFIKALT